ncbi:MAG: TlpA family protein disulfide reductase [Coprobacter sp.]|nr:TlpA family protein disulfide reductase [Coprobacter sp.]
MKKALFITAILGIATSTMWADEPVKKNWEAIDGEFVVGKATTTIYRPENTPLAGEQDIKGTVYFWQDYKWIGEELNLQKTDTGWVSTVSLPKKVALVAYKYRAGNKYDNGGSVTYAYYTRDAKGKTLPSANVGWALLRARNMQEYSVPYYMNDSTDMWIEDDVVRFWLNQEVRYHPESRKEIFEYATNLLHRIDPEGSKERIRKEIDFILSLDAEKKLPEIYLYRCHTAAEKYLRDKELARSLENMILKRHPKGILARDKEIFRIYKLEDMAEKEVELNKFLKKFPTKKFRGIETEAYNLYYGHIYRAVVYTHVIADKNNDMMYKYLPDVPTDMLATFFWHLVQIPYNNKQTSAQELLPHARTLMTEIAERERYGYWAAVTDTEWLQHLISRRKDSYLVYAQILNENDLIDEAAVLAEQLKPYYGTKSADFNDFYVEILEKSDRHAEVVAYIESGVKENAASPAMLDVLKQAYVARTGSEKGYNNYIDDLKSDEAKKALKARVMEEMCNAPIQLFEVEALEGHRIDMGALRGKIIVLDFWATWCGPCKRAMPGMQMAVNKYADDENVQFFFVATQETDPKFKEKIAAFIAEKGYNFQVVFDEPRPDDAKYRDYIYNTYAKAFHFSGIPQKMIIDGNGNLRWRSTGYYGSPSALCDEISYIIEYLKNENK